MNRPTVKSVPASPGGASAYSVYYGYDLRGLMTFARFSSTTGSGITNTYDALGRLATSATNMDGTTRTLTSTYDAASNRTALSGDTGAWGYTAAFGRDTLGRLSGTTESGYSTSTLAYDQAGRLSSLGLGFNGTSSSDSYGYDSVGRLTSLGHDLSGTTYDQTLGFSYNPASQIKQNTRSNDAYAWTGHYNVTRNYTSNGLNQYTASGSATLSYDANGNLSSDGSTSYVYDDENRLVSASGGHSATLAYDPLGRLWQVSSTSNGTTRFFYDGDRLAIESDGSGTVLRAYVHGDRTDQPLIWYEAVSGGTSRRFLHRDERGSITAVADQSGNAYAVNGYDEYGIPNSGNQGRFGYTGQAWIPELGLWYYKARTYSPTLGRFLQTDWIGYGDGLNWYDYAHADPINFSDPTGMCIYENWAHYEVIKQGNKIINKILKYRYVKVYNCNGIPDGTSVQRNDDPNNSDSELICVGTAYVMKGNPDNVGKEGFTGVTVTRNSAAVVVRQWTGALRGGPVMRALGPGITGIVFKHGDWSQVQTFRGVMQNINNLAYPNFIVAQDAIMGRAPWELVLELVNGEDWDKDNIAIISMPNNSEGCPQGTVPIPP